MGSNILKQPIWKRIDAIENAIERQQGAASKNRKIEKNEETLSATVRNGKIVGSNRQILWICIIL